MTTGSHRQPKSPALARRLHTTSDYGAAQALLLIALAAGALLLIPVLFGAALISSDDSSHGACGQLPTAQPGVAAQAEASIPANYLRLYRQAGQQYGLPWNILAAIGKSESDHGRDRSPGSGVRSGANHAGAAGPMQLGIGGRATNNWGGAPRHPADQDTGGYGVDGNGDGWADVHDPADAVPSAARYLLDHGAPAQMQRALFAYNHDTDYVRRVLDQAARYAAGDFRLTTDTGSGALNCPGDVGAYAALPGGAMTKILTYAKAQLGKPYIWGAEGPDSFDCSGLTMMAYRTAGIAIPRTTFAQWNHGARIRPGQEQPGDLVFFDSGPGSAPGNPGHVGLVYDTQRDLMIAAPSSGDVVKVQSYRHHSGDPMGFTRPSAHQ